MQESLTRHLQTVLPGTTWCDSIIPICDYNHYEEGGGVRYDELAQFWVQDASGDWTPLCAPCIPEFWEGSDRQGTPFMVYPITNVPAGPKRLKTRADR